MTGRLTPTLGEWAVTLDTEPRRGSSRRSPDPLVGRMGGEGHPIPV